VISSIEHKRKGVTNGRRKGRGRRGRRDLLREGGKKIDER